MRNSRPLQGQMRLMNGQDQYAPEWGVSGFPAFDPFSNACANFWVQRPSIWRPLADRFGSVLGVSWRDLGSQFGSLGALSPGSPLGILVNLLCWFALSMDEPEVRRVGFAQALPPSRARAPLLLLGEGELWFGRGALCNAREAEIRTYGSSVCFLYTHLFLYI